MQISKLQRLMKLALELKMVDSNWGFEAAKFKSTWISLRRKIKLSEAEIREFVDASFNEDADLVPTLEDAQDKMEEQELGQGTTEATTEGNSDDDDQDSTEGNNREEITEKIPAETQEDDEMSDEDD
jgi:hypothetical protein